VSTPSLGRLTRVELRAAWKNESSHFTPWLAQPENIALLAETMGLSADGLEVQGQEQAVGPFRADILCRNTEDNSLVLIENQLERTDHSHLGQLLTYAAGLKAVTLVWIAERFTPEHRASLDWLNEITGEGFHIFGFEVELWRIGDSPFAPKFNVVVQPNEWARTLQRASHTPSGTTTGGQLRLDYWTSFAEFLVSKKAPFKPPRPSTNSFAGWGVGRAGTGLAAYLSGTSAVVQVEIVTIEHPTWFAKLRQHEQSLAEQTGLGLEWIERLEGRTSFVRARRDLDMHNRANWPDAHAWMLDCMTKLKVAFTPLVKQLDDEPLFGSSLP
jgi:hypothetical protein